MQKKYGYKLPTLHMAAPKCIVPAASNYINPASAIHFINEMNGGVLATKSEYFTAKV